MQSYSYGVKSKGFPTAATVVGFGILVFEFHCGSQPWYVPLCLCQVKKHTFSLYAHICTRVGGHRSEQD